ncbi:IS110 family transposase [Parafrankia sp. BMG5.11]|uniref:IS110 family transposase n=1 Tax=Parafrankia sp. BMG5.11 TaxID=222540 RepID=UPI00103B6945|nr:IS110 family transposase [Parafrankia sp. BMG5.11]TCJ34944.1 IS110 family transposase [Parafrankia sp. BMG5.11]
MMLIGVDPHKSTHTATVVEPDTNRQVASIRIDATLPEYRRMLSWAARWPQRRWAVENAEGLGRHLASWLLARGEQVVDVPSTATARVRQLSRGGGRKNDRLDAAAAACVAAFQGDARPLAAETAADALAVLDEQRVNLAQARVRAVNQLHALLRALLAGGAPKDLSAATAAALLRSVRPSGDAERARKAVAGDLVAEIRSLDTRLKASAKAISALVDESGSTLTKTVGVGPIIAGRLIGRTGRPSRFPNSAAYANYVGAAPVEVASAGKARHRLSRAGDRQLNSALHTVAVTQIRTLRSPGNLYYQTKIAEGKTPREARRCLKRRLADHLWRVMIADERRAAASPGGHPGTTLQSSAAGSTPTTSSSDKSLPRPAS